MDDLVTIHNQHKLKLFKQIQKYQNEGFELLKYVDLQSNIEELKYQLMILKETKRKLLEQKFEEIRNEFINISSKQYKVKNVK